jgi:tRNA threonylcarbamoyladenosine biosynthesis protein TsaE
MKRSYELPAPEDTDRLGAALARAAPAAGRIHLSGELGAGKSSLARAFLRELGVQGAIRSPTYTLVETYETGLGGVAHLDLYRLALPGELDFLGLDALSATHPLWLVEWPERGGDALPDPDLRVALRLHGRGRHAEIEASTRAGHDWLRVCFQPSAS